MLRPSSGDITSGQQLGTADVSRPFSLIENEEDPVTTARTARKTSRIRTRDLEYGQGHSSTLRKQASTISSTSLGSPLTEEAEH